MISTLGAPRFSGLICHTQRRDPETARPGVPGVRIFKYELTNDTSQYPLGRVVCPQSGKPGLDHPAVEIISRLLPELAKLSKNDRLEVVRKLIRQDSKNWQIGQDKPTDLKDECLADRGERLLQQSTADIRRNANGSLSMIMDYDLDQRGGNLTELLKQQQLPSQPVARPSFQYVV